MNNRNQSVTTIHFSKNGELSHWSVRPKNWDNDTTQPWITWKKSGEVYNKYEKSSQPLRKDIADQWFKHLHVILREFLNQGKTDTLELLLLIKSAEDNQSEIELYHHGAGGWSFSSKISIDQMIHFIRIKNNTYLQDTEISEAIVKITSSFQSSSLTASKSEILADFTNFYNKQKQAIFPRVQLVEQWATEYAEKYKANPFQILSGQRRTGCLSIFNPKEPDSIKFFKKFMRGETVSEKLQSMLSCKALASQNFDLLSHQFSP